MESIQSQTIAENNRLKNLVETVFAKNISKVTQNKVITKEAGEGKAEQRNQGDKINIANKTLSELRKLAAEEKDRQEVKDINIYQLKKGQLVEFLLRANEHRFESIV